MMQKLTNHSKNVLGIDMRSVYQSANYIEYYPPTFEALFESYKIEVLTNTDLPIELIEEKIREIDRGEYNIEHLPTPYFPVNPEAELFNFLLQDKYAFLFDGKMYSNPAIGVW